jgi:regulator of sigma E protease
MINFVYSILGFVVALGILVTVHEFGHFWVARRMGVKVLRFSVGFGRPLWTRRGRGGTEFVLAAIPLGGYVKMLDENEAEVAPAERDLAFNRKPLWRRSLVVLAGPMANFLFAVLAYWAVFATGMDGIVPVVGGVAEQSLAERSGFKAGDTLVEIDGRAVQSWDEHRMYLFNRALAGDAVDVVVERAQGDVRELTLELGGVSVGELDAGFLEQAVGLLPQRPEFPAVIGSIEAGSPAAEAGLQSGDRVMAVDDRTITLWPQLVEAIQSMPGRQVTLVVERAGTQLDLTVTPQAVDTPQGTIGRIGAGPAAVSIPAGMRARVSYGPFQAAWRGVENTWLMTSLTVKMLIKMLELEVSAKNISGPLTIAQYAGQSAQIGVEQFLFFLAIVSISLGVLNLLPIPILDGGHLLYYAIEAVIGGPLPTRVMLWGQQIGIAMLVGLMGLAFYNDIARILQ